MGSFKVLSTKELSSKQLELFQDSGLVLKEYNAIHIETLPFKSKGVEKYGIVSSQNSAKVIIQSKTQIKNVFCVGEKTALLLINNNYNVVKTTKNASELADFIVENHKNDSFSFFCGNKRRDELPQKLNENKVKLSEEILYKTTMNPQKFNCDFDGILFFSPSAIQSYIIKNSLSDTLVFCIGQTTAKEAKKYTNKVIIAHQATIENTIVELIRHFKG